MLIGESAGVRWGRVLPFVPFVVGVVCPAACRERTHPAWHNAPCAVLGVPSVHHDVSIYQIRVLYCYYSYVLIFCVYFIYECSDPPCQPSDPPRDARLVQHRAARLARSAHLRPLRRSYPSPRVAAHHHPHISPHARMGRLARAARLWRCPPHQSARATCRQRVLAHRGGRDPRAAVVPRIAAHPHPP